jgi:hypothetical protein
VGTNVLTAKVAVSRGVSAFDADMQYAGGGGGGGGPLPAALGADAPAGLRAASLAAGVTLHWGPPACLAGGSVKSFSVELLDAGSSKVVRGASVAAKQSSGASYSFVAPGLQPCKHYRVSVAALSSSGPSTAATLDFSSSCSAGSKGS